MASGAAWAGLDAIRKRLGGELSPLAILLGISATGLPVYVEKLDTGGGIVAGTTEEIRNAMVRLAGDAALRREMGEKGRATALERYVWDTEGFVREHLLPGE